MRAVGLASILMCSGLLLAACGDNETTTSDSGLDSGVDGSRDGAVDATVDARMVDSQTPDAAIPSALLVDSDDATSAIRPRIAVNANGTALAVWMANCTTVPPASRVDCQDIWGNRFNGTSWGAATLLDTLPGLIPANSTVEYPSVCIDSAGNGVATWSQNDGTKGRTYVARTNGGTWAAAEILDDNSGATARRSRCAAGNGTAVVVWEQGATAATGPRDIWASRLTGTTWSPAQRIETMPEHAQDIAVAMDAQGNAVAVWRQFRTGTTPPPTPPFDMWSNRLNGTSGNWGTAELIENEDTAGTNGVVNPSVAMNAAGTAVAVWADQSAGGSLGDVKANRFSGTTWGTAERIENSTSQFTEARIALDGTGRGIAVWQQEEGNNVKSAIGNIMSSAGTWGTLTPLETFPGDANSIRVAAGGNGSGIVVWNQTVSGGNSHITGVTVMNGVFTATPQLVESQNGSSGDVDVGMDNSGRAIVIWVQNITPATRTDIFSARLP